MEVGRFYLQKRNYTAAINRFRDVVAKFQTTRHVEEALMRLTEAYMALGIVDEAQTAAAVLGHNFPDSTWYQGRPRPLEVGRARAARGCGLLDQPQLPRPHADGRHQPLSMMLSILESITFMRFA